METYRSFWFMLGFLTILVAASVLPACAVASNNPTPNFSSDEKAVAEVIAKWDKAYENVDMATLASLLTDDAVLESTVYNKKYGKDEYLKATEKRLESDKNKAEPRYLQTLDLKIAVSGEQAETVKKFTVTISASFSRGKAWTGVYVTENKLRLEGDLWKIYFAKTYRVG